MRLARSVMAGLFFVAYGAGGLLFGSLLFPVLALLGSRDAKRRRMRAAVRVAYRVFVRAGAAVRLFRVEVSDRERLAEARGCVVAANHVSLIDVIVIMAMLPDATCVVKGAVAGNFFMRAVVRWVFLVNSDPEKIVSEAADLLRQGVSVLVFPEGTRMPDDGAAHPLRRGAARLALAAGAPLLPVRLACTPPVLARGQPWHQVGDREVVYRLEPRSRIPVSGPSTHAAAAELTRRLGERMFA